MLLLLRVAGSATRRSILRGPRTSGLGPRPERGLLLGTHVGRAAERDRDQEQRSSPRGGSGRAFDAGAVAVDRVTIDEQRAVRVERDVARADGERVAIELEIGDIRRA